MIMEEKELSQEESLHLITKMIQKDKKGYHERGTSAILWGSVVAIAGLLSFAQMYWAFSLGFDIWLIVLAAFIPQIFISIRESRERKVVSHTESTMNAVWITYGISIFALIFYINSVTGPTMDFNATNGVLLTKTVNGKTEPINYFVPSTSSLFLLLYAIPTLAGGLAYKFRPMLIGALICYGVFVASIYTSTTWDYLMNGLAGIFNWLIPGLILRHRYLREKKSVDV